LTTTLSIIHGHHQLHTWTPSQHEHCTTTNIDNDLANQDNIAPSTNIDNNLANQDNFDNIDNIATRQTWTTTSPSLSTINLQPCTSDLPHAKCMIHGDNLALINQSNHINQVLQLSHDKRKSRTKLHNFKYCLSGKYILQSYQTLTQLQ
jgi:hypothetical protein